MRLSKPTRGKLRDMDDAQPGMCGGKLVQDVPCGILRTVVHGNDFQIRIIDFHECGKCGGQFLFFVPRGQ